MELYKISCPNKDFEKNCVFKYKERDKYSAGQVAPLRDF